MEGSISLFLAWCTHRLCSLVLVTNCSIALNINRSLHLNTGNFSSFQLSVQSNFIFASVLLYYSCALSDMNFATKSLSMMWALPIIILVLQQWEAKPKCCLCLLWFIRVIILLSYIHSQFFCSFSENHYRKLFKVKLASRQTTKVLYQY